MNPKQEKKLNDLVFSYKHDFLTKKLEDMTDTQLRLRIKVFSELQQKRILALDRRYLDYSELARVLIIKEALI